MTTERFEVRVTDDGNDHFWAAATDHGDPISEVNRVTREDALTSLCRLLRRCIDDGKAAEKLLPLAEEKWKELKRQEEANRNGNSREAEG